MQLIYRGSTYNFIPTKVNARVSQASGKYRGITDQIQQTIAPAQPRADLKYRGVRYSTKMNWRENTSIQEAIAQHKEQFIERLLQSIAGDNFTVYIGDRLCLHPSKSKPESVIEDFIMYRAIFIIVLLLTLGLGLPSQFKLAAETENDIIASAAPLLDNLGSHHHRISTRSSLAQRYFDQGLTLAYAFNHAEAARSFNAAAKLDSDCAMCYWGLAYVLGPNINAAMEDEAVPQAWEAMQQAIALSPQATVPERAYIQALAKRYSPAPVGDRASLDLAYANAMGDVAQRYPNDLDAATLFAEALMDTMPWDYWHEDGEPKPETVELLATLESVLQQNPHHAGANHLYIHAVEEQRPELGIAAADRLGNLVPGAGHLVHMPSHIYIRVGRYHDAVVANQKSIEADQDYVTQCHAQGLYPVAYMPHNQHFLWYAATMAGQKEVALEAAKHTAMMADRELMREPGYGTLQHYYSMPLYTWVKFGMWEEVLAQPSPEADLLYPTGVWHYARGMARAATGQLQEAQQELEKVKAITRNPQLESVTIWDINTTAHLLQIASEVLAGEIAAQQGDYEQAIAHLQTAVDLEDSLNYDEPAPWYSPLRQSLGAALLAVNRPAQAEQVYREDLQIYPDNGWLLWGLLQSLQAQGKSKEAKAVQKSFHDLTLIRNRDDLEI